MKKNFYLCLFGLAILCLSAVGAAAAEVRDDGDRIVFGSIGEASNLIPYLTSDSASHEIADLLYVAPLRFSRDLEPEPWAAESWSQEDGGRVLRFTLRKGIRWEDGEELTLEFVSVFEVDGQEYRAFFPAEEEEAEE